jgi:hypothetical protein
MVGIVGFVRCEVTTCHQKRVLCWHVWCSCLAVALKNVNFTVSRALKMELDTFGWLVTLTSQSISCALRCASHLVPQSQPPDDWMCPIYSWVASIKPLEQWSYFYDVDLLS